MIKIIKMITIMIPMTIKSIKHCTGPLPQWGGLCPCGCTLPSRRCTADAWLTWLRLTWLKLSWLSWFTITILNIIISCGCSLPSSIIIDYPDYPDFMITILIIIINCGCSLPSPNMIFVKREPCGPTPTRNHIAKYFNWVEFNKRISWSNWSEWKGEKKNDLLLWWPPVSWRGLGPGLTMKNR